MALPIAALTTCCSSLSAGTRTPTVCTCYSPPPPASCLLYFPVKSSKFYLPPSYSLLGQCRFGPWNGFRQLGVSIPPRPAITGRRGRCSRGMVVRASLFGVGAPEALVIGVVALLVFGPKGLAEVARNLGKTLRAFQPTIKELQEVSREFKSSLEREIGLDDLRSSSPYGSSRDNSASSTSVSRMDGSETMANPDGSSPGRAYTSDEYLKITEEQLRASAALKQTPPEDNAVESKTINHGSVQEPVAEARVTQKPES